MTDKLRAILTLGGVLMVGAAAMQAQGGESPTERAIEYRRGMMEVFSWNLSAMGDVVKGEAPYDKAVFARHARDLAHATDLDLLKGFPEDSVNDESDAKDEIWLQWKEFAAKFRKLQEESAKLAKVSAAGNLEKIKPQFKETAETCKACHKDYRK
jgi:cytochrome c556